MTAQDRLLTAQEADDAGERYNFEVAPELYNEAIAQCQDTKTLKALRPIVEESAGRPCLHQVWKPREAGRNPHMGHYEDCGHCATCQARAVLAELDAKDKGKEPTP